MASRSSLPSFSASRSRASNVRPMTEATDRTSRCSSGSRSILFSTTCWMVAGIVSAERPASPDRRHSPVSSAEMPPESTSERTSSFVKKGLPSVPS